MNQFKQSLSVIALTLALTACSINKPTSNYNPDNPTENQFPKFNSSNKKIITDAFIILITKDPISTIKQVEKIAKKNNGYLLSRHENVITIRVVNQSLDNSLNEINQFGKIQQKSLSSRDVTHEYKDFQIRLENAQKSRNRYLDLLKLANDVESILKIEAELERLNEKIELIKGQISRIDEVSFYSTITVEVKEKKKPGLIGYIGIGFYQSVKWLFVRN